MNEQSAFRHADQFVQGNALYHIVYAGLAVLYNMLTGDNDALYDIPHAVLYVLYVIYSMDGRMCSVNYSMEAWMFYMVFDMRHGCTLWHTMRISDVLYEILSVRKGLLPACLLQEDSYLLYDILYVGSWMSYMIYY